MTIEHLSAVIPVWNEEAQIAGTIRALAEALTETEGVAAEILVVDDGSTDGTAAAASAAIEHAGIPGRVIRQENSGRLAARRTGLGAASGSHILFLDSRVALAPGSLRFAADRASSGEEIWNAHVEIETEGNPYGRFWRVLTELVFSEYFGDPRTTTFDAGSFDRFPKGTTCFLAPTDLLREAFASHTSRYADERRANDDTPILRHLARKRPIGISPSFACTYAARTTLGGFTRHAFHRGIVFLDGHGNPESRFFPLVAGFYPASVVAVAVASRRPKLAAGIVAAGALTLVVAARRRGFGRDSTSFGLLAPVYVAAHGAGMWRGLTLAALSRLRP